MKASARKEKGFAGADFYRPDVANPAPSEHWTDNLWTDFKFSFGVKLQRSGFMVYRIWFGE